MTTLDYKPGEILERTRRGISKVSTEPTALDVVLYIEYILLNISIKDTQKITINEGQYHIGYLERSPYRIVYLEDGDSGQELFRALKDPNTPWEIIRHEKGNWVRMLEYAYEKVRTCMGSLDKFVTEFPPMGVT
jgi:hypothetical protein